MNNLSYQELEASIDECMLADRYAMRSDIKKKKERGNLQKRIFSSMDLVRRRRDAKPAINYPEILPVSQRSRDIIEAIRQHQVVIVAGETGSGKTTQLPKICLEAGRGIFGLIGHTQPRRVAARTIAHRVAEELDVTVGESVGYQVRFQDMTRPETLIKVMTDGVLLAETQNDRFLERYDTLIIDEAHERSLNIDFMLGYLKRILPRRPDLKVIITSATIDTERFSQHFDGAPVIEVSGRTYPVEVNYRELPARVDEDSDPVTEGILQALGEIDALPSGNVLIFLPGEREIRETAKEIKRRGPKGYDVLPLYSRLSVAEQNRVFSESTERRIVLATNVAETSLTVPGVRYVIDPGLARMSRYSFKSKVQQLPIEPVSQASANQRKGRCGRLSDGVCFRLFSEDDFEDRPEFTEPEILRTNLASVILQMLHLKLGDVDRFPFVERPDRKQINDGFALLFELGAVDQRRHVTRLGKQLARFPVDLRFARMLVAAGQMGCLEEVLIIASALTIADPRERPFDHQQAADEVHKEHWHEQSDFMALVLLWKDFETRRQDLPQSQLRKHCKQHYLSYIRMREWREVHRQLLLVCREQGLGQNKKVSGKASKKVADKASEYSDIHRAVLTGLLGHVSVRASENEYQGARNRKQFIFPGSSQFSRRPKWIVSAELVETSRLFARTVAEIDSRWLEPLAGHLVVRTHHDPVFDADTGQVLVREEVTLYGIVIVASRMIDFGGIDMTNARELFIQNALVDGKLRSKLKFYQHNRRLIRDIEKLESKVRKRDILIESRALFDFYDQMLPLDIVSETDLRRYVNDAGNKSSQLELSTHELMRREARLSADLYPNQIKIGDTTLPLKYKFEPGNKDDGVSVDVPLVLLHQVPHAQLDWAVPGLLEEKCLGLIKSLPKSVRKNFVPAPEYVSRVLESFDYAGKPIAEALAERLFRMTGIKVNAADFRAEQIEKHLTVNIRVLSDTGKVIAKGRNLDDLLSKLAVDVSARLDQRGQHDIERAGIIDWDFGDLPGSVTIREAGVSVVMYPAIVDEQDSVSIKLLESEHKAAEVSRRGLLRLLLLRLKDQRRYLEKNIPGFVKFSLYYATRGGQAELRENIVKAAFWAVFIEGERKVQTESEYEIRVGKKSQLFEQLDHIARIVASSLKQGMALDDRIKEMRAIGIANDLQQQLQRLLPPEFPFGVPFEWLRHYPRYFRAIEHRLDRFGGNIGREMEAIEQINLWWTRFDSLDENTQQELGDFRWMLEEYRISLFAQSVGTSIPVSEKRLARSWSKVMGKAL
ncbi:MAG: ATP-dependent helicase HrpA [Candidatus Azotimanducaceae bacterium]|jgi:ATP-dependent helicase HrpA